jgi:hypothetical protein
MKKNYSLLVFLLATFSILAQAPEKMSYQVVLRDASNTLLTNQQVGIQISILQTTITGTAVYIETQTATTNLNGLVSLEIGSGTSSDDFSAIDWNTGPFFIKTATDASGGSSYSIVGTSQLLSVPYALYAKTAGNNVLKENTANKSTNVVIDGASDVKFPSVKSVKTYVDALQSDVNANETASLSSDAILQGYIDALEVRIVALEATTTTTTTTTDINPSGSILIPSSAFLDPSPPDGWTQCAGYTNTAGDDVSEDVLNGCTPFTRLRIRLYDENGTLVDDIHGTGMSISNFNNRQYITSSPRTNVLSTNYLGTAGLFSGNPYGGSGSYPMFSTGNGGPTIVPNNGTHAAEIAVGGSSITTGLIGYTVAVYR